MRTLVLALLALAGTAAVPEASAIPYDCHMPDVDCYVTCLVEETIAVLPHVCVMGPGEPITYRDCPSGTNGPAIYLYGQEVVACWH